MICLKSSW